MTDLSGVSFRVALRDGRDGEDFCALYNSFYRRRVTLAYYDWQFFQAPFPCRLCVAEIGGRAVGFYGLQIRPAGRPGVGTAWTIDIMIHPDYQDRGLFRRLAAFAEGQARTFRPVARLVMANSAGADAHLHGLGWRLIEVIRDSSAPSRPRRRPVSPDFSCRRAARPPERIASWGSESFGVRRDRAFLEWRFSRHPIHGYEQFVVGRDGRECGYMALKTFEDPASGERSGDVVELICRDDNEDLTAEMLEFVLDHFHRAGVSTVTLWPGRGDAAAAAGFAETSRQRFFCGAAFEAAHEKLSDFASWRVTMADAELY